MYKLYLILEVKILPPERTEFYILLVGLESGGQNFHNPLLIGSYNTIFLHFESPLRQKSQEKSHLPKPKDLLYRSW